MGGAWRREGVGGCGGGTGIVLVLPRTPSHMREYLRCAPHSAHLTYPPAAL
jgi:hypothetical protein